MANTVLANDILQELWSEFENSFSDVLPYGEYDGEDILQYCFYQGANATANGLLRLTALGAFTLQQDMKAHRSEFEPQVLEHLEQTAAAVFHDLITVMESLSTAAKTFKPTVLEQVPANTSIH